MIIYSGFVIIQTMNELPKKLAFIDVETTGGNSGRDRIIEIGIVRVENNKVVKKFNQLIDPDTYLPPEISRLTGITAIDLEKSPTFRNVIDDVEAILDDCVFVAHNARFDYAFVKAEFRRLGRKLNNRQLCTVRLSRQLFPDFERHNLDEVIARFGIKIKHRHRALDDATAIWHFYKKAGLRAGEQLFLEKISQLMLHPSTPTRVSQTKIDTLPELPGVYVFYGESGMPLYVGKSVNIKERVLSHLSSSMRDAKELRLATEVAHIETHVCSGELGALLFETKMVKELQPLHNRMLRQSYELHLAKLKLVNGYKSVSVVTGAVPDSDTVGVFKAAKSANDWIRQQCRECGLCERIMGIERMRKTCFASDIGKCKACTGLEDTVAYNMRFDLAVADNKIMTWPFNGPILVTENGERHMFDNWCYLGRVKEDVWDENTGRFDVDTYKILKRFVKDAKNMWKIKVIAKSMLC